MRTLLIIEETRTFKIVLEGMESLEEAKSSFDPCEDLDGELPVGGSFEVVDVKEVIDCPDCGGKGFTKPGYHNCQKCGGKGWILPDPKKKPAVIFYKIIPQTPPFTDDICEWCGQRYPVQANERFYMAQIFDEVHTICGDCYDHLKPIRKMNTSVLPKSWRIPISRSATSQKSVFHYLKDHPGSSAQEIGNALWTADPSHPITKRKPEVTRREWASDLLKILKEKGLVYFPHMNKPRWYVVQKEGERP